uniref:Uncharacterized protein n=1 Tax=Kalanchoe fedtschenkoi TaxID=63787 RepID=A0A7N1A4V7_KALFE
MQGYSSSSSSSQIFRTLFLVVPISLFSVLIFFSVSLKSIPQPLSSSSPSDPYLFPSSTIHHTLFLNPNSSSHWDPSSFPSPPSIAYFISGSYGDLDRIQRLLHAVYHPKNFYLLHLDRFAPQRDRDELAMRVQEVSVFHAARNVFVVGKADFAYQKGSTFVSTTLRGASILLRLAEKWDWFVNLSAKDYPLVTQDDLLHILSYLPKNLNFVNHTSYIGWKEVRRMKPIIVDPGLYLQEKTDMFRVAQKRDLPRVFQLFTGLSTSILTRELIEFCILGSNNFPRTLLMYFANMPSSQLNYFPTVVCNSKQFKRSTINGNLQFTASGNQSRDVFPRPLDVDDFNGMKNSGAAFAAQVTDLQVLDHMDRHLLGRHFGQLVPGGWCIGDYVNGTCSSWGDADILRPGEGSKRLEKHILKLLANGAFLSHQCQVE